MSHYIPTTDYNDLIAGLLTAGEAHDPRTRIIELLGDHADLWPDSILSDPESATPVEVLSVMAFLDAVVSLTLDPLLKQIPDIHERVTAILATSARMLPTSAVQLTSAEIDQYAAEASEGLRDDAAALNEAKRILDTLMAGMPAAA
ncbi:hypothetical protein [Yoonia sp.]|uniref:hypothetical protein n=1 Tax=Yoonia sp. TaxID=2212373 RepID=UPI00391B8AC6